MIGILRIIVTLLLLAVPCFLSGDDPASEINIKAEADGTLVEIPQAVVTAIFPDNFYIETPDRSYGIKINKNPLGMQLNSLLSVSGVIRTDLNGERYVDDAVTAISGSLQVDPLGLHCRALGGGDYYFDSTPPLSGQQGVTDGYGLNNIGLFVKLCGKLNPVDASRAIISDGSGADVFVNAPPGYSFPELISPYPYVALTGISSCEKDADTGSVNRLLKLSDPENIQWLTSYRNDYIAVLEPDIYLSAGNGNTNVSSANLGGYVRFVLFNNGGSSSRITDVLLNGVSLNGAFKSRKPDNKEFYLFSTRIGTTPVPQQLLNAGDPIWYRILPIDGQTNNTQVLVRLRSLPQQQVTIAAVREDATIVSATVDPVTALTARFGFVTVDQARANVYAYVVLPSGQNNVQINSISLDGLDVTSKCKFNAGYYITGVLPFTIALQSALGEGTYHIIECSLTDGRKMTATFRANNAFATAMYGSCDAKLAQGTWKSILLNSSTGNMDSIGKEWKVKLSHVGQYLQYGPRIESSTVNGNSFGMKLIPASGSNDGGLCIVATQSGVESSAYAQYADELPAEWIKPDELHDGDVLAIKCIDITGGNSLYSAYLNGRLLMWFSGAPNPGQTVFSSIVDLDQPGFVSYTNAPDFIVDSFSLVPDAKSAPFSNAFDTPYQLDYHLEESEEGTWTVQSGACYHTKKSSRNYGRSYIRTIRSDYNTGNWVYEVSFNRYSQSPQDYKYMGFGNGTPSASYYGIPVGVFFSPDIAAGGPMNVYRYNGSGTAQLVGTCGNFPGWGTERVRLTKTANNLKFEVDFNYAGGAFTPDGNAVNVDLADVYYSFLNTLNSRLFFGCTEAGSNWFDNISVVSSISGPAYIDEFTQDDLAQKYIFKGDIDAPWIVDTQSPGTLIFDTAFSLKAFLSDISSHYMDTWLGYSTNPLFRTIVEDYGVRLHPDMQDSTLPNAQTFAAGVNSANSAIYGYWLFDEPDVYDHVTGTSWGVGSGEWNNLRLGLYSQYLVNLVDSLRAGDPKHPSLLNVDCTYVPDNYYIYGQLADISAQDYYYPILAYQSNWDPLSFIYDRAKIHRAACMPNPAIRFLNASSDPTMAVTRAPFPGEQRIMAYAALAGGDNGLFYYWYNCDPNYGCQYQTELWAEIGKINREYRLLAPYIGTCFPISLSSTATQNIWVRTVAAGPDNIICVVINKNYVSTEASFTYTPVSTADVQLALPPAFSVQSVVTINSNGPASLPYSLNGNTIDFDVGPMELGRLIILTTKTGLLGELQSRW